MICFFLTKFFFGSYSLFALSFFYSLRSDTDGDIIRYMYLANLEVMPVLLLRIVVARRSQKSLYRPDDHNVSLFMFLKINSCFHLRPKMGRSLTGENIRKIVGREGKNQEAIE